MSTSFSGVADCVAAGMFCFHCCYIFFQGDHLSGKPGNVGELYRCQGNVKNFTKSHGNVGNCQRKNLVNGKLYLTCISYVEEMRTEDCVIFIIFHCSVAVDDTGFYSGIIMKSLSLNMNLTV